MTSTENMQHTAGVVDTAAADQLTARTAGAVAANPPVMGLLHAARLRPYLTTEEAAEILCVQPQTLRRAWSQRGAYGNLKPFKVKGVRRLYWPTEGIRCMIEGSVQGGQHGC